MIIFEIAKSLLMYDILCINIKKMTYCIKFHTKYCFVIDAVNRLIIGS